MEALVESVQPPLFRRHARRPRLTRILDESRAQAIVLIGPAGYGKTTLAMEWLQDNESAVWYRATNASADLAAFSEGIADVVAPLVPGAGDRLKQRLRVADTPERAARPLAELLAEDLAAWPEGCLLVVDDYHLVADSDPVEDFVDWLLTLAPQLHVLVTTRRRPRWASARRILYGEITEIGREQLAMNNEEAARVLDERSTDDVRALVMQAEGWPALIGLAALTSRDIPEERVSDALYRYFAEEVVRREPPEVERFMLLASVPAALDERIARDVLHVPDSRSTVERLVDEGLLHTDGVQSRFHPLLRAFLRRRLEVNDPETCRDLVNRAIEDARQDKRWEEGFALAIRAGQFDAALELVDLAAPGLFDTGRVETLDRWLSDLGTAGAGDTRAQLVQAEVLLRKGSLSEAAVVAEAVAASLAPDAGHASRAWHLAGQALYLRSQTQAAVRSHYKAREVAKSPEDMKRALWGLAMTEAELGLDSAEVHVNSLQELAAGDINAKLRVGLGRQIVAASRGSFAGIWEIVSPLVEIAEHADDPMAKTTLWANAAYLSVARSDYDRGARLARRALDSCANFRLDFAKGYCLGYVAIAEIGLRRFSRAAEALEELAALADRQDNSYLRFMHVIAAVRLALARGRTDEISNFETHLDEAWLPPASRGELSSLLAVGYAARGDSDQALEHIRAARELTAAVETRFFSCFADLIIGSRNNGASFERRAADLIREAHTADFLDALVVAYRASPELLSRMGPTAALPVVLAALTRARDHALARAAGLAIHSAPSMGGPPLTRRESEVLALLGRGLTNAEIARRLFITESTTKVHVHHILKKLGARTRLQAALLAQAAETSDSGHAGC
jgi:ATP/maltotriose-dependent transcriptional regulator MalT